MPVTLLLLAAERCHQAITRRNGLDCEVEDVLKLIQLVESGLDKAGNLRTRPREFGVESRFVLEALQPALHLCQTVG